LQSKSYNDEPYSRSGETEVPEPLALDFAVSFSNGFAVLLSEIILE
jgi:hypothetical protein